MEIFMPRGGTAMQVPTVTGSNEIEETERQIDGNAFCFLPLPISTGLPCHINGHFAVHTNRNSIFWGTQKDDFYHFPIAFHLTVYNQNIADKQGKLVILGCVCF
jgi:hypothetical protein